MMDVLINSAADIMAHDTNDLVALLRQTLRSKDASLRATRQLQSHAQSKHQSDAAAHAGQRVSCTLGDCAIDLTTGIAPWSGVGLIAAAQQGWAHIEHGHWIGSTKAASEPKLLVASVTFPISEPNCASFQLAIAAEGKIHSATLNGYPLVVPPHSHRVTTAQAGSEGLDAKRGSNLFKMGSNTLVVTVSSDVAVLGLYVSGYVQLLCPMDEATLTMQPAHGPVYGGTVVELRSNVHVC
jgi:hypothetical protein